MTRSGVGNKYDGIAKNLTLPHQSNPRLARAIPNQSIFRCQCGIRSTPQQCSNLLQTGEEFCIVKYLKFAWMRKIGFDYAFHGPRSRRKNKYTIGQKGSLLYLMSNNQRRWFVCEQ